MNKYFVIASHARFNEKGELVHGTASELAPYLQKKHKCYTYIQHSLFTGNATHVSSFNGKRILKKKYGLHFLPFPIRIVQEFFLTIYIITKLSTTQITFIGIDPLNAWIGLMLKKFDRVQKVVFYTADYAENRYANYVMNTIYHTIDRFCIINADQVWNVSSRITALRKRQGISENKNFFIPNAPVLDKIKKRSSHFKKHTLVIVTHITKAIDFTSIILAVKQLKDTYKDIKLIIVGNGDYREELTRKVTSLELTNTIIFTGSKTHDEVMKIVSKAGVGLAIYTNDFPWTRYGDSMKAREYLVHGLPVIINDIPSTADDIKKSHAGIVISSNKKIKSAIEQLFANKKEYAIMRNNALALSKESNFSIAVDRTKLLTL